MSGFDVTVCIAQYNHIDLLEACLASLAASTGPVSYEIIVVDNKSADDSVARLRHRTDLTLIANDTNRGYAGAIDQALAQARGRYVLVLNNDTAVAPDTLAVLTAYMDAHPDVGASGCALYPYAGAPGPVPSCNRYFPSAHRVALENLATFTGLAALLRRTPFFGPLWGYPPLDRVQSVAQIVGAFMFVRRKTIDAVGPMDDAYFLYLEETDWCYRMRAAGWEIHYTPATHAVHLGSRSTSALTNRAEIYRASMTRYLTKHRGTWSALAYRLQVLVIERTLSIPFQWLRRLAGRRDPSQDRQTTRVPR